VATLAFANRVNFNVHAKHQFYTDRLCPSASDVKNRGITPRAACDSGNWGKTDSDGGLLYPTFAKAFSQGKDPNKDRFSGNRLMLGGSLEVAIDRYFSTYVLVDFLPGQYTARAAFRDDVNGIMFDRDQLFYISAGGTLKL